MTSSLTESCLFCGKSRIVADIRVGDGEAAWATLISVFATREKDGHTRRVKIGSGTVVTVCRECRSQHSVAELVEEARKVW